MPIETIEEIQGWRTPWGWLRLVKRRGLWSLLWDRIEDVSAHVVAAQPAPSRQRKEMVRRTEAWVAAGFSAEDGRRAPPGGRKARPEDRLELVQGHVLPAHAAAVRELGGGHFAVGLRLLCLERFGALPRVRAVKSNRRSYGGKK